MKRMNVLLIAAAVVVGLSSMSYANIMPATLTVLGEGTIVGGGATEYQLIYDSSLNVTWLDYTLPDKTWQNQMNAAMGLTVDFDGTDISGWSLPTDDDSNPADAGNQLGTLFLTELKDTSGLTNTGPFDNLKAVAYWSDTVDPNNTSHVFDFHGNDGTQQSHSETDQNYGLVCVTGDVDPISPVPEPGTVLLVGTGLAAFAMISKRRRG